MDDHPRLWYKFLHLAEYWYNTSFHTSIQISPFKALYGRDPPSISDYASDSTTDDTLAVTLQQHHKILAKLKTNFQKSKIQMEKQAIQHRVAFTFKEGVLVLLKLQPYRQTTIAKRLSQKIIQVFLWSLQSDTTCGRSGLFAGSTIFLQDPSRNPCLHAATLLRKTSTFGISAPNFSRFTSLFSSTSHGNQGRQRRILEE